MTDARSLLLGYIAYTEGVRDAIDSLPNEKQWSRITARMDELKLQLDKLPIEIEPLRPVAATVAEVPTPVTNGEVVHNPLPELHWRKGVAKWLEDKYGYDPESAQEAMGDGRFRVDLNCPMEQMADRVAAGNY